MAEEKNTIPFVKPARVGNYKVWRSKDVGKKTGIEYINVSNLDGWSVKIPQTAIMFATIVDGFALADDKQREQFLGTVFGNMQTICMSSSVDLHDALSLLTDILSFPYLLLSEKEMEKRMRAGMKAEDFTRAAIKEQVNKMIGYRREVYDLIERKKARVIESYERFLSGARAGEDEANEQLEQDDVAEQALQVLSEERPAE